MNTQSLSKVIVTLIVALIVVLILSAAYKFQPTTNKNSHTTIPSTSEQNDINNSSSTNSNLTGSCGENLSYALDTTSGVLTITGTGTALNTGAFFRNRNDIKEVVFSPNITTIINCDFENCTGLEEIIIPDSVEKIDRWSFKGCTNLKKVYVSKNISRYSAGLFRDCNNIEELSCPASIFYENSSSQFGDLWGWGKDNTFVPQSLKQVSVIGRYRGSLTSEHLFENCKYLKSITFQDDSSHLSFKGCTNLTYVKLGNETTYIYYKAFKDCAYLTQIIIPDTVESIGDEAFANCTSLKEINIPNSVESIGDYAFYGCTSLGSELANMASYKPVYTGKNLKSIGSYAFYDCKYMNSIVLSKSIKEIGNHAFENTGIRYVYYSGTADDWSKIDVDEKSNEDLWDATGYYEYNYNK